MDSSYNPNPTPPFLLPQLLDSYIEKGSLPSDPKHGASASEPWPSLSSFQPAGSNQSLHGDERMVIHFDINETILIGDRAGGDTVEDCLNKVLAKSAFVKVTTSEETTISTCTKTIMPSQWWDGREIDQKDSKNKARPSSSQVLSSSTPTPLYVGWDWPKNTCPYYRTKFKDVSKRFLHGHGYMYQSLYEEMKRRLSLDYGSFTTNSPIKRNPIPPKDHPFHYMLHSFFHTLDQLFQDKATAPPIIVLRTFGDDLEDIAEAISDFAQGKHPLFPHVCEPRLILTHDCLFRGRWRWTSEDGDGSSHLSTDISLRTSPDSREAVYDLYPYKNDKSMAGITYSKQNDGRRVASGDDEVLSIIENCSICGIQDDYQWWSSNQFAPSSGKPVWKLESCQGISKNKLQQITQRPYYHHLIFDDNIHNDPNDCIVGVRQRRRVIQGDGNSKHRKYSNVFQSLSGSDTINLHGKHLFRVPTIAAILDNEWFLKHIKKAKKNVKSGK